MMWTEVIFNLLLEHHGAGCDPYVTFSYNGGPRDQALPHSSCCGASDETGSKETISLTKYFKQADGLP